MLYRAVVVSTYPQLMQYILYHATRKYEGRVVGQRFYINTHLNRKQVKWLRKFLRIFSGTTVTVRPLRKGRGPVWVIRAEKKKVR